MKKFFLILALSLLGLGQMVAQESGYTPFVREGVQWVCYFENNKGDNYMGFDLGRTFFTLEIKGDTVIDGKSYKAMHKYSADAIDPTNDTILVYLREEGRIVYGIIPEGKTFPGYAVGYGELEDYSETGIFNTAASGKEFILYEFNETESYYKYIYWRHNGITYLGLDQVDVEGRPANRHHFLNYYNHDCYFIEGIGFDGNCCGYPLSYLCDGGSDLLPYYLSHVIKDGKVIYKGINYLEPAPDDGRMPMVREGMQWVFERTTIDHGVTTSEYYTYELRGIDPRGVPDSEDYDKFYRDAKLCRYYKGVKTDGSEGEIVSSLRETNYCVYAIDNIIMDKVVGEGRNLLRFPTSSNHDNAREIYWFDHRYPKFELSYYISMQLSPKILTSDNFTLVDPVEIDGYSCNRYAYFDENGQVQCYIIEGIGIDSRDMGDLLAPFTRKPDPDADYQEYCGLSHVIMDGRIIYKGMRYDPDRLQAMEYDVNGDMAVDISDVAALIDMLLGTESPHMNHADVDSSGSIEISDVTTLIDYILSR